MGKKNQKLDAEIGNHRHRKFDKWGNVSVFGAWHPVDAEHKKESTQEAHKFSVELDMNGVRIMKEIILNG